MFHRKTTTEFLCIAVAALFSLPVAAQAQDALGAGLQKCAGIADDAARLNCFDALVLVTGRAPAAAESAAAESAAVQPAAAPLPAAGTPPAAPAADPTPAVEPVVAAVPVEEAAVEPLGDEIGRSSVKKAEQPEPKKYSAKVTRCDENAQSGQYYFYFDNGQVWKQSKYRRLHWNDCNFDVEVSKGMFGYDMYIPEKERKIRITRIR